MDRPDVLTKLDLRDCDVNGRAAVGGSAVLPAWVSTEGRRLCNGDGGLRNDGLRTQHSALAARAVQSAWYRT